MKTQRPIIISARQATSGLEAGFNDYYSDNMLFQREAPIPIRGFGQPGSRLRVSFAGEHRQVRVQRDGRWATRFKKRSASSRGAELLLELRLSAKEYRPLCSLSNILVGDLWICSGQSNMEMGLGMAEGGREAALQADDAQLRLLLIEKASSPIPRRSLTLPWRESSPDSVLAHGWDGFSAAAWWFGRALRRETGIPVGLVQAAYGGAKLHPFLHPSTALKGISKACKKELLAEVLEYQRAEQQWSLKLARDGRTPLSEEEAAALHPLAPFNEYNTLKIGCAWNALLAPLDGMPAKGFLWYQGESDADNAGVYADKMKLLARQSARRFRAKHFMFVQIAPWTYGSRETLPALWEAQSAFAAASGFPMVGTVDIGDMTDIHPAKKREVGERLAGLALRDAYGRKDNGAGSPILSRITRGEESIAIEFKAMNGKRLAGLEARGNKGFPVGFAANWKDGRREDLHGRVDGNGVLLDCPDARNLSSLEYAFRQEAGGNLFSLSGEPAIPFKRIF